MNFKKWLTGVYYSLKKEDYKLKPTKLCGVPLKTYEGTIRSTPDQDDAWFYYLAKNHKLIYDIGANVGYTALLAMIQDPNRNYVLVDPNPLALQRAQGNLLQNKLGAKALYYPAFVSDKNNEVVKFYTLGSGAAGSMHASHAQSASAVNSFQEVPTVSLAYLYKFYGLKPDLIKIDVEGAETLVMDGAHTVAKETQCSFFIEMHHVEDISMEEGITKMILWAKEANYNVWYLKTGALLTTANSVKHRGKCHILLLPKEKEYPDYLKGVEQGMSLPTSI
ncbi:FkbM family methyltransferase [Rasiella sp. SM2506]|uniref:FkbM family methyltransferase n=1 Tax=Rasiella sp. SM2506 TaxID=3423914 RepID=UPI003D7A7AFA